LFDHGRKKNRKQVYLLYLIPDQQRAIGTRIMHAVAAVGLTFMKNPVSPLTTALDFLLALLPLKAVFHFEQISQHFFFCKILGATNNISFPIQHFGFKPCVLCLVSQFCLTLVQMHNGGCSHKAAEIV
jgi:hypothetical protein